MRKENNLVQNKKDGKSNGRMPKVFQVLRE
jgi:hypothetical protein